MRCQRPRREGPVVAVQAQSVCVEKKAEGSISAAASAGGFEPLQSRVAAVWSLQRGDGGGRRALMTKNVTLPFPLVRRRSPSESWGHGLISVAECVCVSRVVYLPVMGCSLSEGRDSVVYQLSGAELKMNKEINKQWLPFLRPCMTAGCIFIFNFNWFCVKVWFISQDDVKNLKIDFPLTCFWAVLFYDMWQYCTFLPFKMIEKHFESDV